MIENRLPTGNEVLRHLAFAFLLFTMIGFGLGYSLQKDTLLVKTTVDSSTLKGIGNALSQYADSHSGLLPSGENWIDQLIQTQDIYPKSFAPALSDCIEGESDIALNRVAAGKKLDDLPEDLVLAFQIQYSEPDTPRNFPFAERLAEYDKYKDVSPERIKDIFVYKDRWNITSGPENIKIHDFNKGALVLFADGNVRCLPYDKLGSLRWDLENSDYSEFFSQIVENYKVIPDQFRQCAHRIIPVMYTILFLSAAVVLKMRLIPKIYFSPVAVFCLTAAFFALVMGWASEWFHDNSCHYHAGPVFGLPVGLWAALCFAAFILNLPESKRKYINVYGIFLGITCSSIIHASLAYSLNSGFDTIIAGIPFGIAAGYLLAWLFAALINSKIKQIQLTNELQNDEPA